MLFFCVFLQSKIFLKKGWDAGDIVTGNRIEKRGGAVEDFMFQSSLPRSVCGFSSFLKYYGSFVEVLSLVSPIG